MTNKVPFSDYLDPMTKVGAFYVPTIMSGITQDIPISREEVFRAVLSILTFKTIKEAISLCVRSENIHICIEFACRAHAGIVWSNTWTNGFAELPFGGVKESSQAASWVAMDRKNAWR